MIFEFSILISILCALVCLSQRKKPKNKLPGPWGLPLVGHLPFLGVNPCRKMMEWKKIYGPIYFIQFGSLPTVVLTDAKIIKEAFNLPAFSGRAQIDAFVEGTERKGVGMSEGTDNAENRQFILKTLKKLGGNIEESMQEEIGHVIKYLQEQSKKNEAVRVNNLFSTFVVNSLWNIIMGQRYHHQDPKILELLDNINSVGQFDSILEQAVMFMPWIGKIIGSYSGHAERVAKIRNLISYMGTKVDQQRNTWVKGQPRHFTDVYFDKVEETQNPNSSFHKKRNFQANITTDLFGASVSTTSSSLEWIIYYLATNEDVQKKVQQEIDLVVGNSRLPCLNDRSQMLYCEAFILEGLRRSSIFPLSMFHRTLTDVEFHGYKIPRNTMIISDLFNLHHDEAIWEDPEQFRPERFIENGSIKKSEAFLAFSSGRRACIGEHTAKDQLFLYVTSICQNFDIKFPPKILQVKPIFGVNLVPSKFDVHFNERRSTRK